MGAAEDSPSCTERSKKEAAQEDQFSIFCSGIEAVSEKVKVPWCQQPHLIIFELLVQTWERFFGQCESSTRRKIKDKGF